MPFRHEYEHIIAQLMTLTSIEACFLESENEKESIHTLILKASRIQHLQFLFNILQTRSIPSTTDTPQ